MKLSVALIATALASKDERAAIREEKRIRQEKRKLSLHFAMFTNC